MKFALTGTRAPWRSCPVESCDTRSGFTLFEALVALALLLAFAASLGPHLFQARRIMANADGRVAAHVLLRSLLEAPFDRASLAGVARGGEAGGLRWRIVTEPIGLGTMSLADRPRWSAFRVIAHVSWAPGQVVTAETVRLGKTE
jgi:hypothetical protein